MANRMRIGPKKPSSKRKRRPLVIYVGCALTHATKKYRKSIEEFKKTLRRKFGSDVIILDFIGFGTGSCRDVHRCDIEECVFGCRMLVAVCDHASTGLGMELGAALYGRRIPVLAIAKRGMRVTRLVRGVPYKRFEFRRYTSIEHGAPRIVDNFIRRRKLLPRGAVREPVAASACKAA